MEEVAPGLHCVTALDGGKLYMGVTAMATGFQHPSLLIPFWVSGQYDATTGRVSVERIVSLEDAMAAAGPARAGDVLRITVDVVTKQRDDLRSGAMTWRGPDGARHAAAMIQLLDNVLARAEALTTARNAPGIGGL